MKSRIRIPPVLDRLNRTQLQMVIYEANLGQEDSCIAARCLIDRWAQADIATEIHRDRSTVSRRLGVILSRLENTAAKLYP